MKLPLKERMFLFTVVFALTVVLIGLAVLQFHWSQEVSAATSARLHENLESSMVTWRDDLNRELTSIFSALQAEPGMSPSERAQQYAQQYQNWSQTAPHPSLIARVLLVQDPAAEHPQLLQLSPNGRFEPTEWPADLEQLHELVAARSLAMTRIMQSVRPNERDHFHNMQHGGGPPPGRRSNIEMIMPVMFDTNALAMARPQTHRHGARDAAGRAQADWIVVQLDRKVLLNNVLPEVVEGHFSGAEGLDYQVALVSKPGSVIWTSDPGFGRQETQSLDGSMPFFGPPRRPMNGGFGAPPPRRDSGPRHDKARLAFGGPFALEPIHYGDNDTGADWQLLVRHRQGSLEAVVAGMRRRNLTLSFGVLLVLAAGIAIIVVSSQRARILARLQMDFVAAVSHELRTPLAVISSAAENIADGVVAGKQQLTEYGTEIKNQAKQLMQLVEQILLFAATRDSRHQYNVRPLHVADVIDAALKNTSALIEGAGITVEQEIAPNLPLVSGDLSALSHCLQNLITNAVKYGGDARWMGIQAELSEGQGQSREVQISVADKGLGIPAAEQQHIFEPFYRSSSATAAQIHGTGLGLPLARDIAEAMGGSLTVASEPGKGSRFTLHLRVADTAEVPVGAPAPVKT
jgi:signal transduction histidine kinase